MKVISVIEAVAHECLIEGLNFGLKAGLDLQKIIEGIRAPAVGASGTRAHRPDELDSAMEMAEAVGVKMPICRFIDELDAASTYDAYYALMKQHML
jgi:hypothetical protein